MPYAGLTFMRESPTRSLATQYTILFEHTKNVKKLSKMDDNFRILRKNYFFSNDVFFKN